MRYDDGSAHASVCPPHHDPTVTAFKVLKIRDSPEASRQEVGLLEQAKVLEQA